MTAVRSVSALLALTLAACASSGSPAAHTGPATAPASTVVVSAASTVPGTSPTSVDSVPAGVFADASALARELSAVEAGIRVPGVTPAQLAALGRRQQLAYRAVAQHPEWDAALLGAVDPVARGPLGFHLAARKALADHAANRPPTAPPTTLPAWTIVEPLPVEELRSYYDAAQAATGVPWQYLAAIHFQETRMGRVVGASASGAVGPMQFLPSTWAACCTGDPTVARDAIMGTARYLVQLGALVDMQHALFGYNPNSGYVGAVTAYAQNMIADPRAYLGYHGWEVLYGTSAGTVRLAVGYSQAAPVEVAAFLLDHPDALLPG